MRWAHRSLDPSAVLAFNTLVRYSPSVFLPQQIVVWPIGDPTSALSYKDVFPAYFRRWQAANALGLPQPFFNGAESLDSRLEFARTFKVTHVLIDPASYGEMTRALARWPNVFQAQYDDGRWAVYRITAVAG